LLTAFGFQIKRDAFLVAIARQVISTLTAGKRRAPLARVVAGLRPLDLNNFRAQVAKQHGAMWPGEDAGEI